MKNRLTTKSYKRSLVSIGILLFSGISLASTGFAAWVVSQGSSTENGGNVDVGLVENKEVEIIDLQFYADSSRKRTEKGDELTPRVAYTLDDLTSGRQTLSYSFDAAFNDNFGMIKFNPEPEAPFEAMGMTVKGSITNAPSLDKLQISLELPKGIKTAVDKGYIIAPEGSYYVGENVINMIVETTVHEVDPSKASFSFDLDFKWGEAFLGVNPSLYFDKEVEGTMEATPKTLSQDTSYEEVSVLLNELRGLVLGVQPKDKITFENRTYNVYNKEILDSAPKEKFKLTIETIAK